MTLKIYQYMKKRGFGETLETLAAFKNYKAVQKTFFEKFEKEQSYYNAYLRVKDILLKEKLIDFELNEENEKVIKLTEKGKEVYSKLQEIEALLE